MKFTFYEIYNNNTHVDTEIRPQIFHLDNYFTLNRRINGQKNINFSIIMAH